VRILITGGAGYIGSVLIEELLAAGHHPIVYDNLSRGHRDAVAPDTPFIQGDLRDESSLERTLLEHKVEAVMHLAAHSLVGESVEDPAKYYINNLLSGIGLLEIMRRVGVNRLIFSSSAAVYGEPATQPVTESAALLPTNPYGETKLAFERACHWYQRAYGLRFVTLRYFNAAGATRRCGERHDPETHLIPIVLQVAAGLRTEVEIFGDDYPTRDGTCLRDYIHVSDLARAHILALDQLERSSEAFNLGCGGGFTVLEVIEMARKVTERAIPVRMAPRRAGDPAVLVASSEKIAKALGWAPQKQDLREIISSAWEWMRNYRPNRL